MQRDGGIEADANSLALVVRERRYLVAKYLGRCRVSGSSHMHHRILGHRLAVTK